MASVCGKEWPGIWTANQGVWVGGCACKSDYLIRVYVMCSVLKTMSQKMEIRKLLDAVRGTSTTMQQVIVLARHFKKQVMPYSCMYISVSVW